MPRRIENKPWGVATVAVLTDLNLEYVAWKIRGYWIWFPQSHGSDAAPVVHRFRTMSHGSH